MAEQCWTEALGNGINIFVSSSYRYNTDSVLLADFAYRMTGGKNKKAADLCSGGGILPLLWCRKDREKMAENIPPVFSRIDAVEVQTDACALAQRSAEQNHLSDKLFVHCMDLRDSKERLLCGSYHLVSCNPPYKALGTGIPNPSEALFLARHEAGCTPEEILAVSGRLLQFGGKFCICQRPERLCELTEIMRRSHIEPKILQLVQQRKSKEPKLFLLCGVKGGKPGLRILPTLFIEGEDGGFSPQMLEIYGPDFFTDR